jgi:hypothetical protein
MSFFDQDFSDVPQDQAELILPPTIQWWRGDRTSQDEVLAKGGFELPVERYTLDGVETINFTHGGEAQPGYGFKGLHLAVLAHSKAWYDQDTGRRVYDYVENRRVFSKLRLWAVVKQVKGLEFLISFSGMDSKAVEDMLNVFKKGVIKVASDKAGTSFPLYSFWMPVMAGPVKEWKQGGYSTPPRLVLQPPLSDEKFKELYVGQEVMAKAKVTWPVAQEWAKRMASSKGEVGNGNGREEEIGWAGSAPPEAPPPPPEPPAEEVEEIPF